MLDLKTRAPAMAPDFPAVIAQAAEPLADFEAAEFAAPFDRFAGYRLVLLGEASHGTSEFYRARAAITGRLIERHGFLIVAVEAGWPDAAIIDRTGPHRNGLSRRSSASPVGCGATWKLSS
jgi:erythromycin esterase-like protein